MSLSYFHQLLCPDSKLHERAHRAGPDTLTLIDTMKALIYLCHRDKELVQSTLNRLTQSNEKILYTLEQLRKGRNLNDDYNEDDVVDMEDDDDDAFEVLDIENTAKMVVEEMTDDSRELLALFEKYRRT